MIEKFQRNIAHVEPIICGASVFILRTYNDVLSSCHAVVLPNSTLKRAGGEVYRSAFVNMSGELVLMAKESYAVAYITVVCAMSLLYDYCLTLGEEIRVIWPTKLSIPKTLFLFNRYVILTMLVFNGIVSTRNHLSPGFCVFYLRWLVVCTTTTNATVQGILLSRVLALYHGNTPVTLIAIFLYISSVVTMVGLTIKDYTGYSVQFVEDFSALPGCYPKTVPSLVAGYWITATVVESVFFILVAWRVVRWSHDNAGVPPALILMARDSSLYFAIIFVLLIVNLFVFEYASPFLSSLFVTPANTVGCIAGARMLLNLRQLGRHEEHIDTDMEMEMMTISELRFGSRTLLGRRGQKSNGATSIITSEWAGTSGSHGEMSSTGFSV